MDFSLNEEQEMLRKSAREFLKNKYDKTVVRELEASQNGFSKKLWKQMAGLDWMAIVLPEEYDGIGWGLTELAILFEELGRAAYDGPLLATVLGSLMLLEGGNDGQKREVLPKVSSGKLILTTAIEELDVAYDIAQISATAEDKDGGYTINGTKLFVPYAEVADYFVVAARTNGMPGDKKGICLFLVPSSVSGLNVTPYKTLSTEKQYKVNFENVCVKADSVIGGQENGLPIIKSVYEKGSALTCTEMVGGAQHELEVTADYTKQRVQFDRPLGAFQAVQHHLANMFIDIQGARWTSYQAVSLLDKRKSADRELAIAKSFANEACQRVAFMAQQLHGGMGVDMDYDLHFYFRRSKAMELRFGTSQIHLKNLEMQIAG